MEFRFNFRQFVLRLLLCLLCAVLLFLNICNACFSDAV